MASGNIPAEPQPPPGHVHLFLYEPESFHLEIPLRVITAACRCPFKYLCYLGWCVLGAEGLLQNRQGHKVDINGNLVDRGVYYYRLPATQQDILSCAVDLGVIEARSHVQTKTTATRDRFRQALASRDGERCVWTNSLQRIIRNRPHGDERNLSTLRSVDDIRNGIMGNGVLHSWIDLRLAVILKTPNPILEMDDVPERHARPLRDGRRYPTSSRYTLQWLDIDDPDLLDPYPNNSDAAYLSPHKPKPSELLLHYNYGAAAVKHWGRNRTALSNRAGHSRPPTPGPVPMGPARTTGDRMKTIDKLANARAKDVQQRLANAGGSAEAIDSEQRVWDEDDVMLFFWGNSKAAMERHAKKEQERNDIINKWRSETTV